MFTSSPPERRAGRRGLLPFQAVMALNAAALGGPVALFGEIRDELGFTSTAMGVIVAAGFMTAFVVQVTLAPHADRGQGRRMATAGLVMATLALLVMALADDVVTWTLCRGLLGFGGGLVFPALRRAASVFDPERVGENLGRMITGEVVGFTLGPLGAALLARVWGIRAPFVVLAVALALFWPLVVRLPADRGRQDEARHSNPLGLLRRRRLQGGLLLVGGYFFLIGGWESVLPVMLQDRGGGALHTALAFTVMSVPVGLVGPLAGRTADRLGPVRVTATGVSIVGVALMAYGWAPGLAVPIGALAGLGVICSFGFTGGQVVVSRAVPEDRQAAALGLYGATEVLGAGVIALPAAALYDRAGAGLTWLSIGVAMLASVLIGLLLIRGTVAESSPGSVAPDAVAEA